MMLSMLQHYPCTTNGSIFADVCRCWVLSSGLGEGEEDTGDGLSAALLWVLDFVVESEENSGDARPKYWAIRCLLDALVILRSMLHSYRVEEALTTPLTVSRLSRFRWACQSCFSFSSFSCVDGLGKV